MTIDVDCGLKIRIKPKQNKKRVYVIKKFTKDANVNYVA